MYSENAHAHTGEALEWVAACETAHLQRHSPRARYQPNRLGVSRKGFAINGHVVHVRESLCPYRHGERVLLSSVCDGELTQSVPSVKTQLNADRVLCGGG